MQAIARAKSLWPRLGTGEDIAVMAACLAGDAGDFVSGQASEARRLERDER